MMPKNSLNKVFLICDQERKEKLEHVKYYIKNKLSSKLNLFKCS